LGTHSLGRPLRRAAPLAELFTRLQVQASNVVLAGPEVDAVFEPFSRQHEAAGRQRFLPRLLPRPPLLHGHIDLQHRRLGYSDRRRNRVASLFDLRRTTPHLGRSNRRNLGSGPSDRRFLPESGGHDETGTPPRLLVLPSTRSSSPGRPGSARLLSAPVELPDG